MLTIQTLIIIIRHLKITLLPWSDNILLYNILLNFNNFCNCKNPSRVCLHKFTFLSISMLAFIRKSLSFYLPFNILVIVKSPTLSKSAISLPVISVYFFKVYNIELSNVWYSFTFWIAFYVNFRVRSQHLTFILLLKLLPLFAWPLLSLDSLHIFVQIF